MAGAISLVNHHVAVLCFEYCHYPRETVPASASASQCFNYHYRGAVNLPEGDRHDLLITAQRQILIPFSLATEIVSRIGNGEWTATQVLEAFISRAAYAQERTNCLTEGAHSVVIHILLHAEYMRHSIVMLESARQRAHDLDAEFAATKRLTGPLHGIPVRPLLQRKFFTLTHTSQVSIKDQCKTNLSVSGSRGLL